MSKKNIRYFNNRVSWKNWLLKNYDRCPELWMKFYKKGNTAKGITYSEAVEEAICHGWIDSIVKKIDEETYLRKFTPRKLNSNWSPPNIIRAEKMLFTGQMQVTGKKLYEHFLQSGQKPVKSKASDKSIKLPSHLVKVLKSHPQAWASFNRIIPSARRRYIAWIISAKKETTKLRRLNQAIIKLKNNELLDLK
jgi:uncharacterized protein YdeI (YjbR/CyaY-like superfamily)